MKTNIKTILMLICALFALNTALVSCEDYLDKEPDSTVWPDDAFVNFDEYRKASMYQVLGQISERIQVLFFTFDQQAVHFFDGARAVNLDAIQVTQAEEEPA